MPSLNDLLNEINETKEDYLGGTSLELLHVFMTGYKFAQLDLNCPISRQLSIPAFFDQWVCEQLGTANAAMSWAALITLKSRGDSEASHLFFDLLSRFTFQTKRQDLMSGDMSYGSELAAPLLDELINRIRPRPAIYLGVCSVRRLFSFLNGYSKACEDFGTESNRIRSGLDDFEVWLGEAIEKEIEIHPKCSWYKTLLIFYPDERAALEQFFEYFDRYCSERTGSR